MRNLIFYGACGAAAGFALVAATVVAHNQLIQAAVEAGARGFATGIQATASMAALAPTPRGPQALPTPEWQEHASSPIHTTELEVVCGGELPLGTLPAYVPENPEEHPEEVCHWVTLK
jgi:hypothetical protein